MIDRGQRGLVLVVAIGLLLALSLFVSILPAMMRLDLALSRSFAVRTRAHYLARAGVEVALGELAADAADPGTLAVRLANADALRAMSASGEGFDVSLELLPATIDKPGTRFSITSTGTARRGEKTVVKQTITVTAGRDAQGRASILTWHEN